MQESPAQPEHKAMHWHQLKDFQVGAAGARLGYIDRLARENSWSHAFARRVYGEYLRFVFLARTAGHPVTPSDAVDQAWHLHLLYTESYWHDLCRDTLGRPLHHGPTRGGNSEGRKFRDWYQRTLDSYRQAFGEEPPRDVWPDSEQRFRNAHRFRRVNAAEHWVIPRRTVRYTGLALAVSALAMGCSRLSGSAQSSVTMLLVFMAAIVVFVVLFQGNVRNRGRKGRTRIGARRGGGAGAAAGGTGFVGDEGDGDGGADGGGGDAGCGSGCGGGCGGCGS